MVENPFLHIRTNPIFRPMLAGAGAVVESIGVSIRAATIGGSGNGGGTLIFTAFAGIAIATAVVLFTTRRSQTSKSPSSSPLSPSSSSSWIQLRSVLFVVSSSNSSPASSSSDRSRLKSPWSRRKRKHMLALDQWKTLFTPDGKLSDNGVKFLKKVRSGGVDPSIRAEVWPFLLGVYELTSSKDERDTIKTQKRKEYEKLRKQCRKILERNSEILGLNENGQTNIRNNVNLADGPDTPNSEDVVSARESLSSEEGFELDKTEQNGSSVSRRITDSNVSSDSDSSGSESSEEAEISNDTFNFTEITENNDNEQQPSENEVQSKPRNTEDFATWQRIIRLDAIRANGEWIGYNSVQATVSDVKARRYAELVGLKDYDHLDPTRIFHAARLVAILEAYALHDPEIGYCQGMSDLLSPIISVMTEDHEAFWCFVGFMKKARHNFRLDEVGIRRQLSTVSKIIKYKDSHLYKHLEKLQAEDCFFVYRMVVVLFRRELSFEQTLCLWEVMWADQAAIRAGIGKSAWNRIRQRAPPTEDLLLYAIAASVLQRRKQIIEKYSSMDEILRECNSMAGHLDVWKLLDDAHQLVVTLHEKVETPL